MCSMFVGKARIVALEILSRCKQFSFLYVTPN
jgi:hypothetical protein